MLEKTIFLKDFSAVKEFVEIANSKDYDIELMYGKYVINAKSIMGVFSLDLTKPVVCVAHCENSGELLRQIKKFVFEDK